MLIADSQVHVWAANSPGTKTVSQGAPEETSHHGKENA
jgi:hypothetical protein